MRGGLTEINIDPLKLPSYEKNELDSLLAPILSKEENFFVKDDHSDIPHGAADYYTYDITIENGDKIYKIKGNDYSLDKSLFPMIDFLNGKINKI